MHGESLACRLRTPRRRRRFVRGAAEKKLEVAKPQTRDELDHVFKRFSVTPRPIVERVLVTQKKDR